MAALRARRWRGGEKPAAAPQGEAQDKADQSEEEARQVGRAPIVRRAESMRIKVIDLVARLLGVVVHIDGLPYGRLTNWSSEAANPYTAPSASPPSSVAS